MHQDMAESQKGRISLTLVSLHSTDPCHMLCLQT